MADMNDKKVGKFQRSKQTDLVGLCLQHYKENPRPRRLGKMFAFWYNKDNEPRIIVGPDFGFSILEMLLVNGIVGAVLNFARINEVWTTFLAGLLILIAHDISFAATVMIPPGTPPRNPNTHSKAYLNKVKTIE